MSMYDLSNREVELILSKHTDLTPHRVNCDLWDRIQQNVKSIVQILPEQKQFNIRRRTGSIMSRLGIKRTAN